MKGCDTFLMVGSAFPYSEFLPNPGDARGVQIDIDGTRVSLRDPIAVNPWATAPSRCPLPRRQAP